MKTHLSCLVKPLPASPALLSLATLAWTLLASYAQPLILAQTRQLADGRVEFQVSGPAGPKRIEFSNDLSVWGTLAAAESAPSFVVADAPPASDEPRFYRARLLGGVETDFNAGAVEVRPTQVKLAWAPPEGATATRVFLAAEPNLVGSAGPARKLMATLSGSASELTVTNLAPGVDCFFRIEMDTLQGAKAVLVHARTPRTPRTRSARELVLQPALREVQGFSPNILIVTLANWPTNDLKTGWQVKRADGATVPLTAVHRHSVPVGAPEYPVGQGIGGRENPLVEVDHRLFLVFGEPIGSPALLEVTGPGGLQFTLPFSDRYLETPVIQLNQVGFNPRATRRWAYVSGWMGDGGPLSLAPFPATAEILLEPEDPAAFRTMLISNVAVTRQPGIDPDAGTEVAQIDLAPLPVSETSRYRVRLPGVGVSWRTEVSERAAFKAFFTITRGLMHNRWGGDLKPEVTEWSRPADHTTPVFTADSVEWRGAWDPVSGRFTNDFIYSFDQPRLEPRVIQGGHHDAGDFDLRPMHTKVAQLLLRAYEITPASFADRQLLLPEDFPRPNGIPDLLDEALWSIRAWEQLQEADGGVRLGAESYSHPLGTAFYANEDQLTYWTFGRDANHTARVAGLFAQAARLTAAFAPAKSAELRERAGRAFRYAREHQADPENLLYGASELFRLTREAPYQEAFVTAWDALDIAYAPRRYGILRHLAPNQFDQDDYNPRENPDSPRRTPMDFVLGLLTAPPTAWKPGVPEYDILEIVASELELHGTESAQKTLDRRGHRHGGPEGGGGFAWGTGTVTQRYLDLAYARLQLGGLPAADRQLLFDALSVCADYVLGGNPNGLVYFTGLGSRNVEQPLHTDSLAFLQLRPELGPMPGIPAYGPYATEDRHGYDNSSWDAFYPRFTEQPPGRRFGDVRLLVPQTEFTVWESQAPHAELFAVLMQGTRGVLPPASYRPGGADHRNPLP